MSQGTPQGEITFLNVFGGARHAGVHLIAEAPGPWRPAPLGATVRRSAGEHEGPSGGGGGERFRLGRKNVDRSRSRSARAGVVFLVCDDPSLRASLLWLLVSAGYAVEACSHSDTAFEEEDSFEGACLLLDLRSSPAKGVDLLDRLGRCKTFPPVILMTGYNEPLAVIRGFPGGGAVQSRPFDLGLLERVEDAIAAGRRARDRARSLAGLKHRLAGLTVAERQSLDELLAGEDDVGGGSNVGGGVEATPTRRSRLLKKLGLRSWSRLVHLFLELQEEGGA